MKQNKLLIVVLIILAVLFVLGQGSYYFQDKEKRDKKLELKDVKELKNSWVAEMNSWLVAVEDALPWFRSELDFDRLKPVSNSTCRMGKKKTFLLTDDKECEINIAKKVGADFQKATLTAANDSVKIKLCPQGEDELSSIRGSAPSQAGMSKHPPELSVVYIHAGGGGEIEETEACEVAEEASLIVLEKGGTLRLQCKGCNIQGLKRTVTVRLN